MGRMRMGVGKAILAIQVILVASCGGSDTKLSSSCSNVFEISDPSINRYDLHLSGSGFQDYISEDLWLVTMRGTRMLSSSRLEIETESFELDVFNGIAGYSLVGVYIDLNGNSRCDLGEPSWEYASGATPLDIDANVENVILAPNGESTLFETECVISQGLYNMNVEASCS